MILQAKKLVKTFGGLRAVDKLDLEVEEKTIHAVIGPNGAGKTTFFNCINGMLPSDEGEVIFGGEHIEQLPTHLVSAKGIGRTFQNIRLFPYMTVLENVKTGTHNWTKSFLWGAWTRHRRCRAEEREVEEFSLSLLEKVGLLRYRDDFARNLPYGEQRRLEIARALAGKPKLILLDEPAAGMNPSETGQLDDFIRSLKDEGLTILLIEHDMKLVMSLADKISVLDYGTKIAEGTAEDIESDEQVIKAYLGEKRAE